MEIRWLGEVELTFNPPFYRSLGQSLFPRGKLGVSLGAVSSKTSEQAIAVVPIL
jgi:hypothetical protein